MKNTNKWSCAAAKAYISLIKKYKFLLRQLVKRDFKTKYKRSALGVVWSLLNPLLTMLVQYIVFSTLFHSTIENFPVYLLSGIVFFNFFSESTTMALSSITGNASLITKVYMPKYIYPVSRVVSSAVNFALSLIPLLIIILLSRTPITPYYLLLAFSIGCLAVFSMGMGMLLSSVMVFFRDMQFIWSVLIMLWTYFTPIFYPVSIIPNRFLAVYKLNPMYHYITFSRIVIIQGASPGPVTYAACLVSAVFMLLVGALVFKKTQNKFVLYM